MRYSTEQRMDDGIIEGQLIVERMYRAWLKEFLGDRLSRMNSMMGMPANEIPNTNTQVGGMIPTPVKSAAPRGY